MSKLKSISEKYNPSEIEAKWQEIWEKEKIYSPNLDASASLSTKKPFYNLMMFPYPSAEGMHVGNMYAFTGADVYGRFQRMQGNSVFEPIGLDGFGIHSENYAIKQGIHPAEQAKISEKNFYRQLKNIGNGFDWTRTVETYKPEYYKWTQWLFIQLFKAGLAYRKKAPVNSCPSCKTVLADEQVIDGLCERCNSVVEKRDLEQWFFKITKYADRLLNSLSQIDWSEKVKTAQKLWIGKSEGMIINFPLEPGKENRVKPNFLILHGYKEGAKKTFVSWLKGELGKKGYKVQSPQLPNADDPKEVEQVGYVIKNCQINEHTVIVGHSLGGIVAMKVLQKINRPISGLVLVAPALSPFFRRGADRPFSKNFNWEFDYEKLKDLAKSRIVLADTLEKEKRGVYLEFLAGKMLASLYENKANEIHFTGVTEPFILEYLTPSISVFTTRPETIDGATFLVLSPQHPKAKAFKSQDVIDYIAKSIKKTDEERRKEKTGVFSGEYVINPVSKKKIPIWIADYVLMGYGTGAIMAVPVEDERDKEFAEKYNIPIEKTSLSAKPEGKKTTNYHLRDWLISRQRYWGPPIPMIYCPACAKASAGEENAGWQPVPEKDLPVELPFIKDYKPLGTGQAPLASHPEFYKCKCPKCGGEAKRETDVSDTFLDSSWYFLRYVSSDAENVPFDTERVKKWLPVNMYIGGAEHSVLHLLYSRFVTMALKDLGFVKFEEPFTKFRAHGLIIRNGAKMSKSKGNVVIPDEYIKKFGADTVRTYLMFMGPFSQGGDFRDSGIEGMHRFLRRVWTLLQKSISNSQFPISKEPNQMMHKTIKKVTEDVSNLSYNTSIAALMEWYNFLSDQKSISQEEVETFLKLLAPFTPHVSEELFSMINTNNNWQSIHLSAWPTYDPKLLVKDEVIIVIQVNGKLRGNIKADLELAKNKAKIEELARNDSNVAKHLEAKEVKKVIYIEGKVINFVVV